MKITVVIPCYRVKNQILQVLAGIGPEVSRILVVDDCCPEFSGEHVKSACHDPRVLVIRNSVNLGVGGAVMAGYREALKSDSDIVVKLDGDGQMDPALIPNLVHPIVCGEADYTKGNRFYSFEDLRHMPVLRLFGNSVLSFMTKLTTGYWEIMDPTNGFTAIHRVALKMLDLAKVDRTYFFETDMLFRLSLIRARVLDMPMKAFYGDEQSNLRIHRIVLSFPQKHGKRLLKRLIYNYCFRDFNFGTLALFGGIPLLAFGGVFGAYHWWHAITFGTTTPTGTIMLSVLPVIVGFQLLLSFAQYDVAAAPQKALQSDSLSVARER